MALPFRSPVPSAARYPVTDRVVQNEVCIISLADARALADELHAASVEDHTQWSTRKTAILELHSLCCRLIAERRTVANRLTRHARIVKQLLFSMESIHTSIVQGLVHELPDVEPAHLEERLTSLVGEFATDARRLAAVTIETGGAR
jgi:hypothetical protein